MFYFGPLSRLLRQSCKSAVQLSKNFLSPCTCTVSRTCNMSDDAKPRFTLYMSGTSYYAQKVMMAFFEKNEPFVEKLVDQRADDNYQSWYMRLNPAGKVPVLQDGSKVIVESEDIIDYLDREVPKAPSLVPDPSSELGQEVAKYRKLLNFNVLYLIYSVDYNPSLSPKPEPNRKSYEELDAMFNSRIERLRQLATENPDLKDAYLAKIPALETRKACKDPNIGQQALGDLQVTLDEVEKRLQKTAEGSSGQTWLLGDSCTAADLSLAILLRRVNLKGLSTLYFTDKRPFLCEYWKSLKEQPSYRKLGDIAAKYGVVG